MLNPAVKIYVDIETTDTAPTAGIWDIGAVVLDGCNTRTFSKLCAPSGTASEETMEWINNQPSVRARLAQAYKENVPQREALKQLIDFVRTTTSRVKDYGLDYRIYSWRQFDFPTLRTAFTFAQMKEPWDFRKQIDLFSVSDSLNLKLRPDTAAHTGLGDAEALAKCHKLMLNKFII